MSGMNLSICFETQKSLCDLEILSSFEIKTEEEGTLIMQLSGILLTNVLELFLSVVKLHCIGDSG
jgi:hypothetical protein